MTDEHDTHAPTAALPRLEIDWALYASMLEDMEASEEDKRELIAILWNIVVAFVDLGFGISSTQQACGEDFAGAAAMRRAVVKSRADAALNQQE